MKYSRKARTEAFTEPLPLSFALSTNGARPQSLGGCGLLPVLLGEAVMGNPNRFVRE
jgi:hypothetical protein